MSNDPWRRLPEAYVRAIPGLVPNVAGAGPTLQLKPGLAKSQTAEAGGC
jgi:hypothetical protein